MSESEFISTIAVCKQSDLKENEMKEFDFMEQKVLMVKQNNQIFALGTECTHYGAPMISGVLGKGHVRCPWHGACFNLQTGDIEDFPGLDSLPCYKVELKPSGEVNVSAKRESYGQRKPIKDTVCVSVKQKDLEQSKRIKDMVKRDQNDKRTFVVVGGGAAGGVCVETLRQEGFTGRIVMVCREPHLPYDRVKVSKALDMPVEALVFRNAEFYAEHAIETWLDVTVDRLDVNTSTVSCGNCKTLKFDKIFIATGGSALRPTIKGIEMENVMTLRDINDAEQIHARAESDKNVVCLGSSFISMEVAACLAPKVKTLTVIGISKVPLSESFGEKIGERMLRLYVENGVKMIMQSGIKEIYANSSRKVVSVQLLDGSVIPCDLLVMGTGILFNTEFLRGTGIAVNPNGSIDTDTHLMTNVPGIYAGGDIANAPIFSLGQERATIGHWQLAQYHGRVAALNMVGKTHELHAVPYFFSSLFGKGLRYSGHGKYTDVLIDGDLEAFKFAVYYLNEDNDVVAVASCGRDPIVAQFAELQSQGIRLTRSNLESDKANWFEKIRT